MSNLDDRRIDGARGIWDTDFARSDDVRAHEERVEFAIKRAEALEEAYATRELTASEKAELPRVATRLRRLFKLQMGATIADLNKDNSADDEVTTDDKLRIHLRRIRNMHIDMNKMWGTHSIRKVSMWLKEDIPNWFGVTTRKFWDNTKFLLKTAGVVAAGSTLALAGGYAAAGWYGGEGALAGLGTLGQHLGIAGTAVRGMFRGDPAAPAVGPVA